MANFSPTQFTFGARINQRRAQEQEIAFAEQELEARRQSEQAEALRKSRQELVSQSIEVANQIATAAHDTAVQGKLDDAKRDQFRQAFNGALLDTITTLQNDVALMNQSGADPNDPRIREIQGVMQMLASHAPVFDAQVEAGLSQVTTPEDEGREEAARQLAQRDALAEDAEISIDEATEALGLVPGQPPPSDLELLERQIIALRGQGVPEDDPRILNRLNDITRRTTGGTGQMMRRLLEKVAATGLDSLTEFEQEALNELKRMSLIEQLMIGAMGGGVGGGGVPSFRVDPETGEMVAQ